MAPRITQAPPRASGESLLMLLKQYHFILWQGLLMIKNEQAAVQMFWVSGDPDIAKSCLPRNRDNSTPPIRILQNMSLESSQIQPVARKMESRNEHCMLLALPCGEDYVDVLKQASNLTTNFINFFKEKQAAGVVQIAAPGTHFPAAYVVHIFPSCDFADVSLNREAPRLFETITNVPHVIVIITTV